MTVAQILAEKGHDIISVKEDASLQDVTKVLGTHKIGAVLVMTANNKVCGILSERDIVRRLSEDGVSVLDQSAQSCCTKNVVSCKQSDSVDDVMRLMSEGRFRHMPVMDDDKLEGMISIGDVVKRRMSEVVQEAEDLKRYIQDV